MCDSLSPNSSSLDVQNMLLKPLRGQDLCGINNPECSLPEIQPCCRICSTQLGDQRTAETQTLWLVCREGFSSQGPPKRVFLQCLWSAPPHLYLKLTLHQTSPHLLSAFTLGESWKWEVEHREQRKKRKWKIWKKVRSRGGRGGTGRKGLKGLVRDRGRAAPGCPTLCSALSI